MSFLRIAIFFAIDAHQDQTYDAPTGPEPYYLHALRVMLAVRPEDRIVAVLHDVLEDAGTLPTWLSPQEEETLRLLTRETHESYADYIKRIARATGPAGEMARRVKLADLEDNLANNPEPRLAQRYRAAKIILLGGVI